MVELFGLENEENPKGSRNEQVAQSEAECNIPIDKHDDSLPQYTLGDSYLVDYAIEHFGAEIISIEEIPPKRPPFPCLTGASNTTSSYKIDQNLYHGIVAAGIDTLELNFGIAEYKYPDMFEHLKEVKFEAVSGGFKNNGEPIDWFGNKFVIQSHGARGGYEFLLRNGDIDLQIMPDAQGGKPSPEVRVIFRSSYLWQNGTIPACNRIIDYLNEWAYINYCQVSRADLCVDKAMPLPELNRKTQVVSRLRHRDLYYGGDFQSGQRNTGYQFGKNAISCRFYDKSYEIAVKGHGHIKPLWAANGWDGISPVSRLEFQLRREGLIRFDINMDPATFQGCQSDIWAYSTGRYLRIVNQNTASRKERAKVTSYWKDYQDCVGLFGERRGVLPYKQLSRDWQPLIKQAEGCLAGAWAQLAADIGETNATTILEKEWGHEIPRNIIETGLLRKAKYAHMALSYT